MHKAVSVAARVFGGNITICVSRDRGDENCYFDCLTITMRAFVNRYFIAATCSGPSKASKYLHVANKSTLFFPESCKLTIFFSKATIHRIMPELF